MRFTAVAEVHRPPSTNDGGMFLAQASGQQVIGNTDPGKAPVILSAPRGDTLANKPKMLSAQMEVLDGIPMEEAECLEPLLISVPDTPLDSKAIAGNMMGSSSDRAVPQKDQTGRPMEGVTSTQLHLDSQPRGYQSMPNRKKYPWSDDIPNRQAKPPGNRTVPSVGVQNNTPGRKVCFYGNQT